MCSCNNHCFSSWMPISTRTPIFKFNVGQWQLFPGGCSFTSLLASASCQVFNTCDPAVLFKSLLVPTGRIVFCWYKYATVFVNQLAKPANSLYSNRLKAVLVLLSPMTYHDIYFECFFECFIALASSATFQTNPTCSFFKDRLVTRAWPLPFPWSAGRLSDMSSGSNRHCETQTVWLVRPANSL